MPPTTSTSIRQDHPRLALLGELTAITFLVLGWGCLGAFLCIASLHLAGYYLAGPVFFLYVLLSLFTFIVVTE